MLTHAEKVKRCIICTHQIIFTDRGYAISRCDVRDYVHALQDIRYDNFPS